MIRIAIPTYNRPQLILERPLAYLERCGIAPDEVDIWISGDSQRRLYDGLPPHWQARMQIGVKGLMANRRVAEATYPEGTRLFWLNDDVASIGQLVPGAKKLHEANLREVMANGFELCERFGCYLWGIYAVNNHFYMSAKVHADLRYVVGCAFGMVLRHDEALLPRYGDAKEDYERALRFYRRDGKILRMDYYAPKTTYYNSPEIFPNIETIEGNIRALETEFPGLVKRNTAKKGPYPEINIKDPRVKPARARG